MTQLDDHIRRERERMRDQQARAAAARDELSAATEEFLVRMARLGNPGLTKNAAAGVDAWWVDDLDWVSTDGRWGGVDKNGYKPEWLSHDPADAFGLAGRMQGLARLLARYESS